MPRAKRNPFARALADAEKELARKLQLRDETRFLLQTLNGQIPNLERTVQALKIQLDPSPIAVINAVEVISLGTGVPLAAAREVPEGAGVILPGVVTPTPATPDIESIPGMEGEWK
jgi:hypothetical protein